MAKVAKKSGWAAVVVIEGKKFKSKAAVEMKKKMEVPLFTVTKQVGKKLIQQAGAEMQVSLKAMRLMKSGVYMDAVQLYSESKDAGRREELAMAAEYARMSAELDPRVYVAHYTHANYLYDIGKYDESRKALEPVLDLPLSATLYSDMEEQHASCNADAREKHKQADEAAAGGQTPKLRVVTVATSERPELTLLRNSVKKSTGIDLETLGLGTVYPGLGFKIVLINEWLKDVPDHDFVLFTDAYDVVFLAPASELFARYYEFCAPMVFGAELACNPDYSLKGILPDHDPVKQPMKYLNSGTYMGSAGDIKKMTKQVIDDITAHLPNAEVAAVNDQRWYWRHWLLHPEQIALDTKASMFHTLHGTEADQFVALQDPVGTILSNITNTMPCIVHGNGEGKDSLNAIVKMLYDADWMEYVAQNEQYHGGINMLK
jgi:hypothetical protein